MTRITEERTQEILQDLIEIELHDYTMQEIAKELTNIGILHKNGLTQTAHILKKRNKFYIVHFKQLFLLDSRETDITSEDLNRLESIVIVMSKLGYFDVKRELNHDTLPHNEIVWLASHDKTPRISKYTFD